MSVVGVSLDPEARSSLQRTVPHARSLQTSMCDAVNPVGIDHENVGLRVPIVDPLMGAMRRGAGGTHVLPFCT